MGHRTTRTHAVCVCDFPTCDAQVDAPLAAHCGDHDDASARAASEGWRVDDGANRLDLCPRHIAPFEALSRKLARTLTTTLDATADPDRTLTPARVHTALALAFAKLSDAEGSAG